MYNAGFYPTPPAVAAQMLSGLNLDGKSILEPSAGKGDLCDAIIRKGFFGNQDRAKQKIHCCEIEPELQATQSEIRARQRRMEAHRRAVESYSVAMAPVFGLDASLPNGDKT